MNYLQGLAALQLWAKPAFIKLPFRLVWPFPIPFAAVQVAFFATVWVECELAKKSKRLSKHKRRNLTKLCWENVLELLTNVPYFSSPINIPWLKSKENFGWQISPTFSWLQSFLITHMTHMTHMNFPCKYPSSSTYLICWSEAKSIH